MRIEISEYASLQIEAIWEYHAKAVSDAVADRITSKILDDLELLQGYPGGGQVEPLLDHLELGHRRLVSGHYKIVYRIIDDVLFVADVFDSRQSPEKMAW
mgnify:CR=1 FL=1